MVRSFARDRTGQSVGIGATGPVPRWEPRQGDLSGSQPGGAAVETDAGHIKSALPSGISPRSFFTGIISDTPLNRGFSARSIPDMFPAPGVKGSGGRT